MMFKIRIILFLISILLLFITSAQSSHVYVDPDYQSVSIGETFTVDIIVDPEGTGICGAEYDLFFNNMLLNATDQIKGPFLSQNGANTNIFINKINNSYSDIEGKIDYCETMIGSDYGVFTSGVLTTITFQVIAEEEGVSELQLNNVILSDNNCVAPPITFASGYVSVGGYMCGDVDRNGAVNILDVRLLMNHISHPGYPVNLLAGDVTGDGYIRSDDVRLLVRHVFDSDTHQLQCGDSK